MRCRSALAFVAFCGIASALAAPVSAQQLWVPVGCDAEGLIGGVGRILGEDRDRHLVGRIGRAREKDQSRYHQASHCRLRRYSHSIFLR
jgi:hypothetical protein